MQPSRGVLSKTCSENMQQIYMGAPMSKCDFNKVAKQLFIFFKLHSLHTSFCTLLYYILTLINKRIKIQSATWTYLCRPHHINSPSSFNSLIRSVLM